MFPSSPSQPPRAAPPAKELPGVAKKPSLPFRGQAPTPLTLRDVATARASTPPQTPTAPSQPKALGAAPGMPQAAPKVASARPVPAPAAPSGPATGPMADDRLQAMKNMQAQAQARPAPSAAVGALDPNRNTLSAGALGAVRQGGMAATAAKPMADLAIAQQQAATNKTLNEQAGTGMDMTQTFDWLKDPNHAPPPGWEWDAGQGHWVPQTGDSALPAGVKAGDPGTYFEDNKWNYGQKEALGEYNLPYTANDLLMGDETQFLMTPEEKAAAQAELDKAAMASQWQQANTMAAHGLGGSGVAMTGLGDIAAKRMTAQNELETSDRAQAMAAYMDKLGLVLPASQNAINEADKMKLAEEANMTDKERFEYQKQQDALANKWTAAVNALGITGGDQLDAAALAELLKIPADQMDAFTAAVGRMVRTKNPDGTISVSLQTTNGQNQVGQGSFETLNNDQQDTIDWLDTEGAAKGWSMQTPPPIMGDPNDPGVKAMWDAASDSVKADNWLFYLNSIGIDPRQEPAV